MTTVLNTGPDTDLATRYLANALRFHTQAEIAAHLGVTARAVRHWVAKQEIPQHYVFALQRLLPLELPLEDNAQFTFIDLFAGIGGIRMAFEELGGQCVFTSEWDSYAQKTYAENFPGGHAINGDITQIDARDIPNHDLLLGGFPCQPFSIAGVSKKMPSAAPTDLLTKRKARCSSTSAASSKPSSRAPSCSKTSKT